jgi:hypothetical protein
LKENISQVGKVKTILNPDTIVDLRNIFFEKAISFEEVDKIKLTSFFKHKQVLIEGGPGQGKSFFLRYLCLNEGESS